MCKKRKCVGFLLLVGILCFCFGISGCSTVEPMANYTLIEQEGSNNRNLIDDVGRNDQVGQSENAEKNQEKSVEKAAEIRVVPEYQGVPYITINDNTPNFTEVEYATTSFENYGELDSLNRCGVVCANIGLELMPTEERGAIGMVKPSGWHTVKYDYVDGMFLYNRCHLIGFQLTGENANENNLITGTRYMNVEGMLPFENRVAEYIRNTGNSVLYRVTPIFENDELVARGVVMEAASQHDKGQDLSFAVYVYNVQPGVEIDYTTGQSSGLGFDENGELILPKSGTVEIPFKVDVETVLLSEGMTQFVLNTNSKKFHMPFCDSVKEMKEKNKELFWGTREEVVGKGYSPCKRCMP